MTEFEEYQEYIRHTHNPYCRIVIRHASIDAACKLYSKWKREISLEYLSEEKFMLFAATDEYFTQPPPCSGTLSRKSAVRFPAFLRLAVAGIVLSALLMQSKTEKNSCFIRRFAKTPVLPGEKGNCTGAELV